MLIARVLSWHDLPFQKQCQVGMRLCSGLYLGILAACLTPW